MKIQLALCAFFLLAHGASGQENWPAGLANSPYASRDYYTQRLSQAIEHPSPIQPSRPDVRNWGGDRFKDPFQEQRICCDLIRRGQRGVARQRLWEDLFKDPTQELYVLPLLDLEIGDRDFGGALRLCAVYLREGLASENVLLRASLATASIGQVFQGQRPFCEDIIMAGRSDDDLISLLPEGVSARTLIFLSDLAIGDNLARIGNVEDAMTYLNESLNVAPANAPASLALAHCLIATRQFTRAINVLESCLSRSGTKSTHESILALLDSARYDLGNYGNRNLVNRRPR